MSNISSELISRFNSLQNQIWQTVSLTVSEVCNKAVQFDSALTVSLTPSDLATEISGQKVIIQFSFVNLPENSLIVILSQETFLGLAKLITGQDNKSADDSLLSDLNSTLEAIVQGICLSASSLKNEPVAPTGLTIKLENVNLPNNLQTAEEILRVTLAIKAEELSGTITWLLDKATESYLLGIDASDEDVFSEIDGSMDSEKTSLNPYNDRTSLDLLLDIPLEISVELGRVKMLVKEIVELGTGSIIEIEKAAGEPIDIMINGRQVARGEVVVIDDNFGARVTEIISAKERLSKLKDAS